MKVGDLVQYQYTHHGDPAVHGIGMILCEDEYRVLDVEVFVDSRREEWEADEVEVISESG